MIQIAGSQLCQWDVGRSVNISDSKATHVHFANQGDSKAVIIEITNGAAKIPDYLLQTGKALNAYAVLDGVTLESRSFAVCKRERPENYVYEDDRRNYIYELITRAEDAVENANQAAQKANEAAEKLGSIVIPTKVSDLENDSGFLTEAPVTSVNGQTGKVNLSVPLRVTIEELANGVTQSDPPYGELAELRNEGHLLYCQHGSLELPLVAVTPFMYIFSCVQGEKVHTVMIGSSSVTVTATPLASGSGADGITPHIGDNGNWFIGETDTGMPSRGEDAPQEAILYTPQALSPEQQAQARQNIGAIEAPETADVGQTIVVKEVDENGKPTAWEAADFPPGGGGSNVFHFTTEATEAVKMFTIELPTIFENIFMFNVHVTFGTIENDFQMAGIYGGNHLVLADINTKDLVSGEKYGVNAYCVRYDRNFFSHHVAKDNYGYNALPGFNNIRMRVNDMSSNIIQYYSKTADVLIPAGTTFEIWGLCK